MAERTNIKNNNDGFLDTDISDLPLPELPVKKSKKKRGQDDGGHSETVTSPEETFVNSPTPQPWYSSRTPTSERKSRYRNASLPRSFRQRNEARAGYLLRRQQRMQTSSAEDLLSFEKRTMNSRMHYGSQVDKPRYFFGETATLTSGLGKTNSGSRNYLSDDKHSATTPTQDFDNEIFLNKSGWVQVKQRLSNEAGRSSRFDNNNSNSVSKLEDLMLRNEARKTVAMQNFYQKGYLPVVRNALGNIESPPPMTPIISPPPAFQDAAAAAANNLSKAARIGKQPQRFSLTVSDTDYHVLHHEPRSAINNGNSLSNGNNGNTVSCNVTGNSSTKGSTSTNSKGMVFSRSFEYDNRKANTDYSDVFSKSFEYDLSTSTPQTPPTPGAPPKLQQSPSLLQIQRERMPAFSNLTGNSPNYLTKKDLGPYRQSMLSSQQKSVPPAASGSTGLFTSQSRDTSPNQAKLSKPQVYPSPTPTTVGAGRKAYPGSVRVNSEKLRTDRYQSFDEQVPRSRRAQFSRIRNESSNSSSSRSFDVATVNRRLNSCDSGARSGNDQN